MVCRIWTSALILPWCICTQICPYQVTSYIELRSLSQCDLFLTNWTFIYWLITFYSFIYLLCMYMCVFVWYVCKRERERQTKKARASVYLCAKAYMWKLENTLYEWALFFYHGSNRDQTQIISLSSKHIYLLKYLTGLRSLHFLI